MFIAPPTQKCNIYWGATDDQMERAYASTFGSQTSVGNGGPNKLRDERMTKPIVVVGRHKRPQAAVWLVVVTCIAIVNVIMSQSSFFTHIPETDHNSLPSTRHPPRRLEFIHIPKTGGTSIEQRAARWNITWGICHFKAKRDCLPPGEVPKMRTGCPSKWHVPTPFWVHERWNPYQGADLFTIIRDPYARTLSEYYWPLVYFMDRKERGAKIYRYEKKNNHSLALWNDPQHMNEQVNIMLKEWEEGAKPPDYPKHQLGNEAYYKRNCHLVPQYDYIFHPNGTQLVSRLVRFENLQSEFTELMQDYHLPVTLPQHDVRKEITRTLKVSNFNVSNLQLIERVYAKDFETFGYEMISTQK